MKSNIKNVFAGLGIKPRSLFLLLFGVLFAGCNNNDNPTPQNNSLTEDEVEIIQLIIAPISASYAIIETTDTTVMATDAENLGLEDFGVTQQVINEEIEDCKTSWKIPKNKFYDGQVWISQQEFQSKTFKELSEEYGVVGVFQFNKPHIYNDSMAILEMSNFCGPLCGNGLVLVAEKENGVWVKRDDKVTWISK